MTLATNFSRVGSSSRTCYFSQLLCSTIFHLIIHCLLAETELAHKKRAAERRTWRLPWPRRRMQKDIWQPWLIVLHASNKMYFARKWVWLLELALLILLSTVNSTYLLPVLPKVNENCQICIPALTYLGGRQEHDLYFLKHLISIRLLDKRYVGHAFLRFLAFP